MTQPTAPSELLREATRRIRETAQAVPGRDRWGDLPWQAEACAGADDPGCVCIVYQGVYNGTVDEPQLPAIQYVADAETEEHAHHIAMWHPGVALAVADLLESVAQEWADMDEHNRRTTDGHDYPLAADEHMDDALAVARLVLGERSGT